MTRSPKCPKCPKSVSTIRNPLICSNCNFAFHKKCCPLNQYELSKLNKSNLDWTCEDCMKSLFPFTSIENSEMIEIFTEPVSSLSSLSANRKAKNKCGKCSKSIYKNFPFFACKKCLKNYHIKCSIDCKETYLNSPSWECDNCVTQELPFSCINKTMN